MYFIKTLSGALQKLLILSGSGQWLLSISLLGVLTGSGNVSIGMVCPVGSVLEQGVTVSYHPGWENSGIKNRENKEVE